MKKFIGWFFGVLMLLSALGSVVQLAWVSVFFFVAASYLSLPPLLRIFRSRVKEKTGKDVGTKSVVFVFFILYTVAITFFPTDLKIDVSESDNGSAVLEVDSDLKSYPVSEVIRKVFIDLNDYPEENGRFKILSSTPLHIQLSPTIVDGDRKDVIDEIVKRAIIYGVYRTFIHTKADKVTVTVLPKDLMKNRYFKQYKKTYTVDRSYAIEVSKLLLGQNLSGLIDESLFWSKSFKKGYYSDQGEPGLDRFFTALVSG